MITFIYYLLLKYSQENTSIEEISKDWLWNLMSNVGIVGLIPAIQALNFKKKLFLTEKHPLKIISKNSPEIRKFKPSKIKNTETPMDQKGI